MGRRDENNPQVLCLGFWKGDGPVFRKEKRRTKDLIVREEKLGLTSFMGCFTY